MDTDYFFGLHIDPITFGGKCIVVLLAVVLGGLIGTERQLSGNAAGLRTHILVCVGSTIITLASVEIGLGVRGGMRGDPGHIAAQIVSGIGFLGAGAIMREGLSVHGITTAASIWTTAGIGIALGASPRLGELAVVTTLIVLGTLVLLQRLEQALRITVPLTTLELEIHEADHGPARILELMYSQGITVYGVESHAGDASLSPHSRSTRRMRLNIKLPPQFDRKRFNQLLTEQNGVIAFHMD